MTTPTPIDEATYVTQQGVFCPVCGDTAAIDVGVHELYVGGLSVQLLCPACGCKWREHYNLSGYELIQPT